MGCIKAQKIPSEEDLLSQILCDGEIFQRGYMYPSS